MTSNDASEIASLRKSLREMHPSLQFVISIHDPAATLKTSAMLRQEAIARIIAAVKEVSYSYEETSKDWPELTREALVLLRWTVWR
jgi:hypothetical protein